MRMQLLATSSKLRISAVNDFVNRVGYLDIYHSHNSFRDTVSTPKKLLRRHCTELSEGECLFVGFLGETIVT